MGFRMRFLRNYFRALFFKANVKNPLGDTPKLIRKRKLDIHRTKYEFDANGIPLSYFKAATERIAVQFTMNVEWMRHGKHQGRVIITFNKRSFPKLISYKEMKSEKIIAPESFYVGYSMEGVILQKIQELLHMIIAGTTGAGKSNFFKGCLLSLLESCKHLQLYIIDLKRGLEAIDFKEAPNVKIVKEIRDAVMLLKNIKKEMHQRLIYLEKKRKAKVIIPEKDKKDRLIVAIDEANVLYMARSRFDDHYKNSLEARRAADSLAKISRSA